MQGTGSPLLVEYRREMRRAGLRPGSIDKRMSVLLRTETALAAPLNTATVADLRGWLDGKRLHPRTVYCYISHWSAFFRWALLEQHTTDDPTMRLTRPKMRPGLPRPVGHDDLAHVIDQAPTAEVRAMLYLAGHAGLRCMEIAQLDGPEVLYNLDPALIVVLDGKGGRQRVVPMSPALVDAVRAHGVPRSGPVFISNRGRRYAPSTISGRLCTHIHACGIEATAHQLRHAFATEVYRSSGGDLRMTQELLGHSSPSTTAVYTAWSQERAAGVVSRIYKPEEKAS